MNVAYYHLPGLFEFYELYEKLLPLYRDHREFFYEWCEIGSIYGAPADCLWGGGRVGFGEASPQKVHDLMRKYAVSARLTLSNSLLREEHLSNVACNRLCRLFEHPKNGIIVHSDLLMDYLREKYPAYYFVSTTTKVITDFNRLVDELNRDDFRFVVPDFRFNRDETCLQLLTPGQKEKVEFLCNECCSVGCKDRLACYENVSRKNLGEACEEHRCSAPDASRGYRFSRAMENPSFIGVNDIVNRYLPMGFSNFKIEGRSLGSAVVLEMILYYLVKPECQLRVREELYLDSMLDIY